MIDMYGIFPALPYDRALPELTSMARKSMSPTKMTVSVQLPGPEYDCIAFRQEYRTRAGSSKPIRYWVPWDGLEFSKTGTELLVTFKNMIPGSRHSIRLAAKAPDGRIGPASVVVHMTMPPKPSRAWISAGRRRTRRTRRILLVAPPHRGVGRSNRSNRSDLSDSSDFWSLAIWFSKLTELGFTADDCSRDKPNRSTGMAIACPFVGSGRGRRASSIRCEHGQPKGMAALRSCRG